MIRRDGRHDYPNQKRNGSMDKSEAETTTLPTDEEGASTSSRGSCGQYDAFHLQCPDLDNQRSELPANESGQMFPIRVECENATTTEGNVTE